MEFQRSQVGSTCALWHLWENNMPFAGTSWGQRTHDDTATGGARPLGIPAQGHSQCQHQVADVDPRHGGWAGSHPFLRHHYSSQSCLVP